MNKSYRNFESEIENDKTLTNQDKRALLAHKKQSEEVKIKRQQMSPEERREIDRQVNMTLMQQKAQNEEVKQRRQKEEDGNLRDRMEFNFRKRGY